VEILLCLGALDIFVYLIVSAIHPDIEQHLEGFLAEIGQELLHQLGFTDLFGFDLHLLVPFYDFNVVVDQEGFQLWDKVFDDDLALLFIYIFSVKYNDTLQKFYFTSIYIFFINLQEFKSIPDPAVIDIRGQSLPLSSERTRTVEVALLSY
jgi:hypothetical protein